MAGPEEELAVVLSLKDQFSKQMIAPIQQMETLQKSAGFMAKQFKAAALIISGSVALMARNVMQTSEELVKINKITGVSIDRLQKLGLAAELNGSSLQQVNVGFRTLSRQALEASQGGEEATAMFKRLGISVVDASGNLRNIESIFDDSVNAISKMQNSAEQSATAIRLFGRAGSELLPLFKEGTAGFDRFGKIAEDLGIVIKTETVEALESFGDQLTVLKKTGQAFVSEGLLLIAENLPNIIEGFFEFSKFVNTAKNELTAFTKDLVGTAEVMVKAWKVMSPAGIAAGALEGKSPLTLFKELRDSFNELGKTSVQAHREAEAATDEDSEALENYKNKVLKAMEAVKGMAGEQKKLTESVAGKGRDSLSGAFDSLHEAQSRNALAFRAHNNLLVKTEADIKALEESITNATAAAIKDKDVTDEEIVSIMALKTSLEHAKYARDQLTQSTEQSNQVSEENTKLLEQSGEITKDAEFIFDPDQLQEIVDLSRQTGRSIREIVAELESVRSADPFYGLKKSLEDFAKQLPDFRRQFGAVFSTMQNSLSNAFESLIEGGKKFKDIMKSFFNDIKRSFIKMVSDLLAQQVMKQLAGILMGIGVGGAGVGQVAAGGGGGGGGMNLASAASGVIGLGGGTTGGAADGGVLGTGISGGTIQAIGVGAGLAIGQSGIQKGSVGQSAAGMALAGASIGAVAGPIGIAVGAIVGAAYGAYAGNQEKKKQEKQEEKQKAEEARIKDEAAKLLKTQITTTFGGGLATEEEAAAIGEIFSGGVDASDIDRLGINARDVIANQQGIMGAAANNTLNMASPNINVNVGSIASHYDVQNVAADLAYHLNQSIADAMASNE